MKITAKEMLEGLVFDIKDGPVNSTVSIRLPGGEVMSAVITCSSVKKLGLTIGMPLFKKVELTQKEHRTCLQV